MRSSFGLAALTALVLAAGCQSEEAVRAEGITSGAGNAIAANTVMQMVDPWPAGVQNTHLVTPADLDQYRPPTEQSDTGADYGAADGPVAE